MMGGLVGECMAGSLGGCVLWYVRGRVFPCLWEVALLFCFSVLQQIIVLLRINGRLWRTSGAQLMILK